MTKDLVIVFVKNPELGKVKTRLARSVGEEAALAIYLKLLANTHALTEQLTCDVAIYYSEYIDSEDFWDNKKYNKCLQKGSELGERMYHAIEEGLSNRYKKVCLIGSDIHLLTKEIIDKAFDVLSHKDVVLGPAADGGYYLIGMKAPYKKVFDLSQWSTSKVLSQTISLIESQGLSYGKTSVLNDIDDLGDLRKAGLF